MMVTTLSGSEAEGFNSRVAPATSRRWCHLLSTQAHRRRIEQFLGNEVTRPLVSPFYLPGLNGPKSTAHEYLSFSCLLCPSNEGS